MRAFLISVCLFASGVAAAQPVVTNEVIVATHPQWTPSLRIASPAVALASDRHGVTLAWAMPTAGAPSRIHIARLGGATRVLSPRSGDETVMPLAPSLTAAPDHDGFIAAWIETNRGRFALGRPLGAFAFLDAGLDAAPPAFLPANEVTSPVIVRGDWIATGGDVWRVERDGTAHRAFGKDFRASAMAVVDDEPTVISRIATSERGSMCALIVAPCFETFTRYRLDQELVTMTSELPRLRTQAEAAVTVEDGELLVAWMRGDQAMGGDVMLSTLRADAPGSFPKALQDAKRLGTFAPDEGPTRPDIATDGARRLIVWRMKSQRGDYDVVGALLGADGTIARFNIAASNADEREPSVLALPGGNFIVAYETFSGGQRSIAWRLVLLEGRRRAVR